MNLSWACIWTLTGKSISCSLNCLWHLTRTHSLFLSVCISLIVSFSPLLSFSLFFFPLLQLFVLTSALFSSLRKDPFFQGPVSLSYFHFLQLPPPIFQPTRLLPSISILFYYSGIQAITDRQACLSLSLFFFISPLFPPFSRSSGFRASSNEQSSSSPGQSKQNQSHIPQAQFAVTSQLCELGVFKLEVWRSSWVASGC